MQVTKGFALAIEGNTSSHMRLSLCVTRAGSTYHHFPVVFPEYLGSHRTFGCLHPVFIAVGKYSHVAGSE